MVTFRQQRLPWIRALLSRSSTRLASRMCMERLRRGKGESGGNIRQIVPRAGAGYYRLQEGVRHTCVQSRNCRRISHEPGTTCSEVVEEARLSSTRKYVRPVDERPLGWRRIPGICERRLRDRKELEEYFSSRGRLSRSYR